MASPARNVTNRRCGASSGGQQVGCGGYLHTGVLCCHVPSSGWCLLSTLAHKSGYFTAELVAMEIKGKKGLEPFVADEHPREATLEKLGQLPPVFKEDGVVTAGNASVRVG